MQQPWVWDDTPGEYDPRAAARFWQVCSRVDSVFKRFKGSLREETGPDPERRLLEFLQAAHRAGSALMR